jgi:hypothetical protein
MQWIQRLLLLRILLNSPEAGAIRVGNRSWVITPAGAIVVIYRGLKQDRAARGDSVRPSSPPNGSDVFRSASTREANECVTGRVDGDGREHVVGGRRRVHAIKSTG